MTPIYLDFDYAEDSEGLGTLEAMVSTWPEQVPAVLAEIARVLFVSRSSMSSCCAAAGWKAESTREEARSVRQ